MLRIFLFLATNVAILVVASVMLQVLGVEQYLASSGLNLSSLLVFCAIFGFGGAFVSLWMSKWIAKRSTGTRILTKPTSNRQEQWLLDTVAELAREAKLRTPEVGIFDARQPNAFATGASRDKSLVAVSSGLLRDFRENEVRAVLAHEIGHVANGDMVTLTLIQGIVNTFVLFFARIIGFVVDRAVFRNSRGIGIGYFITTIFAQIVLSILASTIVMWFSRRREFRADAYGANLAGTAAMVMALERLRAGQAQPAEMPDELVAFGISGGKSAGLRRLWMSHPPLEERIAALKAREATA